MSHTIFFTLANHSHRNDKGNCKTKLHLPPCKPSSLVDIMKDDGHDPREACREAVLCLFPDICPDYLEKIGLQHKWNHEVLITYILDVAEKGSSYPKRPRTLKRKRSDESNDDEEPVEKFDKPSQRAQANEPGYVPSYVKTS